MIRSAMREDQAAFFAVCLFSLVMVLFVGCSCADAKAPGNPKLAVYAVVEILYDVPGEHDPRGSGVVIETKVGKTMVLSAAHVFQGRGKVRITGPFPRRPGGPYSARLVRIDRQRDLALIQVGYGPWPYVAPVADPGHRVMSAVSAGYDAPKSRWEAPRQGLRKLVRRRADVLGSAQGWTWTRQPGWHGRSGGGLIDPRTGELIGIAHGYEHPYPHGRGLYVSLQSIRRFLAKPTSKPRTAPRRYCPPAAPY